MSGRPLPASFYAPHRWTCPLHLAGCKCTVPTCRCADPHVKNSELCESRLMPWMMEHTRQAPVHQRLPIEVWAMVLEHVRDRGALAQRVKQLVRTSRFSEYCDLLDLVRLYTVVGEAYFFAET